MRIALLIALALILIPSTVLADELRVRNEGGLEIIVYSDSDWEDVQVSADSPITAVGPGFEPAEGKAKVASATLEEEWVVIEADNIQDWEIVVACNQQFEDVEPEVVLIKDRPKVLRPSSVSDDGGESIAKMNLEKDIKEYNESHGWLNDLPL